MNDETGPRTQSTHRHRWMFLMTKGNYEVIPNYLTEHEGFDPKAPPKYTFVEYAYLICNGPGHDPEVRKVPIEKLDGVDFENAKS